MRPWGVTCESTASGPRTRTPHPSQVAARRVVFDGVSISLLQITTQWAAPSSGLLSLPFLWGLQELRVVTMRAGRCAPYGGKRSANLRRRPWGGASACETKLCAAEAWLVGVNVHSGGLRPRGCRRSVRVGAGGAREGPGVCVDERDAFPWADVRPRGAGDGRGRSRAASV